MSNQLVRRLPRQSVLPVVALASVAALLYPVFGPTVRIALLLVFGALAAVTITPAGVSRTRQVLLSSGIVALAASGALSNTSHDVAYVISLAFYGLGALAVGSGALIGMNTLRDVGEVADATIIFVASFFLGYFLFVASALDNGTTLSVAVFIGALLPLAGVLVFWSARAAALARPDGWLRAAASVSFLAAAVLLATRVSTGHVPLQLVAWPLVIAFALLVGTSLCAPAVPMPPSQIRADVSPYRAIGLAIALGTPVAAVVMHRASTPRDLAVLAGGWLVLTAAVVWRVTHVVSAHARLARDMEYRATHDELTGLPNRAGVLTSVTEALGRTMRPDNHVAVLFVDMDNFKAANDTHGHDVGDELLKAVARRLRSTVRPEDIVARLGGDEFIVLLEMAEVGDLPEIVGRRIVDAFNSPLVVAGVRHGEFFLTPSIGIAVSEFASGVSAQDLLRDADTAMYVTKESGRNNLSVFDPSMRDRNTHRFELEAALRGALKRGELAMHYQPLVEINNPEKLLGFEALMRWTHPQYGKINPSEFIPIAEENGVILSIGTWALQEATRQLGEWQRTFNTPDLMMAVNLSPRQVRDSDVVQLTKDALQAAGVEGRCLSLEITESVVITDAEGAIEALNGLHELGVKIAMDDFGTGYSSLSNLSQFPIDCVKIDQTFVAALSDGQDDIVRAVLGMAEGLHLQIIAEGVEEEDQRDHLIRLGCTFAQGFLYSVPLDPAAAKDWITTCLQKALLGSIQPVAS